MNEEQQETGDYVVDEKDKNANLTEEGVRKAERFFQVENLADPDNLELQHNINLSASCTFFDASRQRLCGKRR